MSPLSCQLCCCNLDLLFGMVQCKHVVRYKLSLPEKQLADVGVAGQERRVQGLQEPCAHQVTH